MRIHDNGSLWGRLIVQVQGQGIPCCPYRPRGQNLGVIGVLTDREADKIVAQFARPKYI